MSTTKTLTTGALFGVILLLVIILHGLRRETESLRNASTTLDRQASALLAAAKAQKASLPAPRTAAPASAARPSAPSGALSSFTDTNAMGDPEYAAIFARRQRRYAIANYRHAIDAMHLSPADASRLKELMAAQWIARADATDVLDRMGGADPALREKARAAAEAEAEQKIKDLLGADGYAEYQAAYQESSTKGMNWALFTDFWDAGVPLNSDQQIALARVMVKARSASSIATSASPPDPQTGLSPSDLQLLETAASFLTPEQLSFLRDRTIGDVRYRQAVRDSSRRKDGP